MVAASCAFGAMVRLVSLFSVYHEREILTVLIGTRLSWKTLQLWAGFVRRARYALTFFRAI